MILVIKEFGSHYWEETCETKGYGSQHNGVSCDSQKQECLKGHFNNSFKVHLKNHKIIPYSWIIHLTLGLPNIQEVPKPCLK